MERGTPAAQQLAAKGAEITHSRNRGLVCVCGVLMGRVFLPWFGVALGVVEKCASSRCDICCWPRDSCPDPPTAVA